VGTGKTVTAALSLSGTDAGNYTLLGQPSGLSADITQLASVAWTGAGGNTLWSTAANWVGGALPDRANVAAVTLGSGTVTYDYSATTADAPILNSLTLSGGTLTVNNGTLTVPTWLQSAGDLRGTGGLTVSQSMTMNGAGTIDVGGPVSINHTGNLQLGRIATAGALSVTATGSLSGTTAGGTWVQTANSIALDANGIGAVGDMLQTATNNLSITNRAGDAWIYNTGLVNVTGSSAGRLHLESFGGITTAATQLSAGTQLTLNAHSPITIGSGGVQGGTGVSLQANTVDAGNSSIFIQGPVSAPSGAVLVSAYNNVMQSANISGTNVEVGATQGSILMTAAAQTLSSAGGIVYAAPAGNLTLARLNAGIGSITLDAGGSIAPTVGFVGVNLMGSSAFINAGGNLQLTTNVTLLDVNVGGNFSVTNGSTVVTNSTPTTETQAAVNQTITAIDNASTTTTPTNSSNPPPPPPPTDTTSTGTPVTLTSIGTSTTGGTEGTFGAESGSGTTGTTGTTGATTGGSSGTTTTTTTTNGDQPAAETKPEEKSTTTASAKKDEKKDEKDKKDKKSDEAKEEKKDEKPAQKKVAQCT
jgi:hypothetical protein